MILLCIVNIFFNYFCCHYLVTRYVSSLLALLMHLLPQNSQLTVTWLGWLTVYICTLCIAFNFPVCYLSDVCLVSSGFLQILPTKIQPSGNSKLPLICLFLVAICKYAFDFSMILGLSGYWIYVMELWKKVVFQRTGSQVWYYQFTNGNGIQWSVDLTEELNCWNMLWKWWKGSSNTEFGSRSI